MTAIELSQSMTRLQLRAVHELMARTDVDSAVTLRVATNLQPTTPQQSAAWMQLVLTWGQTFNTRTLELAEPTVDRFRTGGELSDLVVIAAFLASEITCDGDDVTSAVAPEARRVLEQRVVLTSHQGDGDAPTASILLAAHTFSNRTSPELHADWEGKRAIEETARTLYHDVWPAAATPTVLRDPLSAIGEVGLPAAKPTHIVRSSFPTDHPAAGSKEPFRPLGARVSRPEGIALDLATSNRRQAKPVQEEVGEILFELVQNTEWHGSKRSGGRTGANCRVLSFREYTATRDNLKEFAAFDPHFATYIVDVANHTQERTGKTVRALTVATTTVIDSGVGLARAVAIDLGEEHLYTPETEVRYLTAALSKSLKVRRAQMGNIGLTRVQQCLTNLRGMMSIRTGTVELVRNFVRKEFEPVKPGSGSAPPPLLLDWIAPDERDFVVGPLVGTAVTISYPVRFEVDA